MINITNPLFRFVKSKLFQNSIWGIAASIFQNLVFSLFFILLARTINSAEFSGYIIANTFYGLVLSFSSLGMSQWFIRNLVDTEDQNRLITLFFYIQLFSGIIFYLFQVFLVYGIYEENLIHILAIILGFNIIFDNIIYVFKSINIAFNSQKKTFFISSLEAFFKLIAAFFIWKSGVHIIAVVFIIIILRLNTLFLFVKYGMPDNFKLIIYRIKATSYLIQLYEVVSQNRYFIFIGSISVLFWSLGNILVSKMIGLNAVPVYEISFKLFSMSEVIPLMFSATVFPLLVQKNNSNIAERNMYYRKIFRIYAGYGLTAFSFVYFFADYFIPLLFGNEYQLTSTFVQEIFLTMLLFPTALLQANLIISMGHERMDMWFNFTSLLLNIGFSLAGLYLFKSLSIVNYSIFLAFWIFHMLQDVFLLKKGIAEKREVFLFHFLIIAISTIFFFSKQSIIVYIP